jgi:SAM-dependent methyltransferase
LRKLPAPAILAVVGAGVPPMSAYWIKLGEDIMRAQLYEAIKRRTTPGMRRVLKSQPRAMQVLYSIFGSDIYSASYYEQVEQMEHTSMAVIAGWIESTLKPARVVDVGCGPGHLIEALHRGGASVLGLDYSGAAKDLVLGKGLPFETFNLTVANPVPGSPWDLAVCCEVAEHLEARFADVFVQNLASASDTILLTAAEVGQEGGLNHVNEQPNGYWIAKFERRGFKLEKELTAQARKTFTERGVIHYLAKPMIFRRIAVQN